MPMEVSPIIRLRVQRQLVPTQVPLAFTFVNASQSSLPTLFPPRTQANTVGTSPPLSISSDSSSPPPRHTSIVSQRPANFQDVLLYDPSDGVLSLRRYLLELKPKDRGTIATGALSGMSILLPKMGSAGKLSVSPLKSGVGRFGPAGKSRLTEMMDDGRWRWWDGRVFLRRGI